MSSTGFFSKSFSTQKNIIVETNNVESIANEKGGYKKVSHSFISLYDTNNIIIQSTNGKKLNANKCKSISFTHFTHLYFLHKRYNGG